MVGILLTPATYGEFHCAPRPAGLQARWRAAGVSFVSAHGNDPSREERARVPGPSRAISLGSAQGAPFAAHSAGLVGLQSATLFQEIQQEPRPRPAGWRSLLRIVMSKSNSLRYGPPGENAIHLCVDMQRMFAEATDWKMPWLERVLPISSRSRRRTPERTVCTRFIPPGSPARAPACGGIIRRWASMTIDQSGWT